jgi:hypothetical protein
MLAAQPALLDSAMMLAIVLLGAAQRLPPLQATEPLLNDFIAVHLHAPHPGHLLTCSVYTWPGPLSPPSPYTAATEEVRTTRLTEGQHEAEPAEAEEQLTGRSCVHGRMNDGWFSIV